MLNLLSLLSVDAYTLVAPRLDARHAVAVAARPLRALPLVMQAPPDAPRIVSDETYGLMLKALLETENDLDQEVSSNYAMIDYGFMQRLETKVTDTDPAVAKRAVAIKEAVNAEMAKRMQTATETLKDIFTSPTPVIMDGKIAGLARAGKIDGALYDLLQANLEQAQAAGEQGANAVAMLTKLQGRIRDEMDQKLDPPVALFRRLMRMDSAEARQRLLKEKMASKKASKIVIAGMGGEEQEQDTKAEVEPSEMAETIKDLKLRFGNVDENFDTGFVTKLEIIAEEAEAVALELAGGRELSAKEAQDMAWNRATVSVWDLEQVEEEAHQDGNFAVWEKEAQDQMYRQEEAQRRTALENDGLVGGM